MPPPAYLEVLADAASVAERAARMVAAEVESARAAGRRLSIMLAGGTTPRAAYERLARSGVDLSIADFYFGDERAVPADHAESNYRMAKEALFEPARVAPERVHRMPADAPDLELAARAYEAELPASLDVLLLGVGADAHTASLFPGSPAVLERGRRVVPVVGPKPPPRRLTVTGPVLESAKVTLVLATGAGKADAISRALEGPLEPSTAPIQLALGGRFLLDLDAAKKLGGAGLRTTNRE
ncbi:MAG: 6-phosphogluconolactonase [Polyangiaceae bacterium]|jgi:6-phosphogluconolactonase|nr:6-phosphogluconolactonase [Polyangiaceae bacterium]MBK8939963.1 6-phosphogluconolactonase [Polyangiaceae bacterium]